MGGTLTFTPGQKQKTVNVPVKGDLVDETNETFHVNLSNPTGASIGDGSGLGTITDDDAVPTLSIADASVTEGDSGITDAAFTVSLTGATEKTVIVGYATQDGTATAPSDYVADNDSLTFSPGETSKVVSIHAKGDVLSETDETFAVVLANPSNATLGGDSGTGTIVNDDEAPVLSIDAVQVAEGDSGTTNATFTVSLSSASGQQVTVDYATEDGSATSPDDYDAASGTLTFTAGQTSKQVTVLVNGDTSTETTESFFVDLSDASGATIGDAQGQGTILDDDGSADVSVSTTDSPDPVQVGSPLTYTVTVSNAGPAPASNVELADALPANIVFVSATPSQGDCEGTGPVTCSLGGIAKNNTATVDIVVTAMRTGTLANTGDVTADQPDGNLLNNHDEEATDVVADANGCTIVGTAGAETLTGTSGADVICAGDGNDNLFGAGGNDQLRGEGGNDELHGATGDDALLGGPGIDSLFGGIGNDSFDGGADTDTASFAETGVTSGVKADLTGALVACGGTPCALNTYLGHDTFVVDGGSGFSTVESLTATGFNDQLVGDGGPNTLLGGAGADLLSGGGGADVLNGGNGKDTLLGLAGDDTLTGGAGNDTLTGGVGNDAIDAGTEVDTLSYFGDPSGIVANIGTGLITDGFGGSDTVSGVEFLQGSNTGNDQLTGSAGRNGLYGNGGNDTLTGLAGNDHLDGGAGTDSLDGGQGLDTCVAGETVMNCEQADPAGDPAFQGASRAEILAVAQLERRAKQ